MLSTLIAALRSDIAGIHAKEIIWGSYTLMQYLAEEYTTSGDARNAAIDALCTFLQTQKTIVVPAVVAAVTPVTT